MGNKLFTILFAIACVCTSCNTESKTESNEEDQGFSQESNTVTEFLRDVKSLESDTNVNPIVSFKVLAEEIAKEKLTLSKDNINEALILAKNYSSCVIVTENHTLVKIENLDDCKQSGSWNACMPKCSGYIKKGNLNFKNDYLNNIIGVPDNQERFAFFFNPIQTLQTSVDSLEMNIETGPSPHIHAISKIKSSLGWELCEGFYCNDFYLTDYLYEYHPVFKDRKDQYLFFFKEWGNWIFCSHFPNMKTRKAILKGKIDIPEEDRICFVNSFDPCGFSSMLSEDYKNDYEHFNVSGEYSIVGKVLKWEGVFDYLKYEEKMLHAKKTAYYKIKQENFNHLLSANNKTNFNRPIPDTTIEKDGFSSTIITYLQKHYLLKEDSVYDSNDDVDLHKDNRLAEGDDYYISERVIDKYYSSSSNNLIEQINVFVHNYEGEMDFSNECTVTFPNFERLELIQLLKLLEIYNSENESYDVGSCDNFYKEVYYSESEDIEVKYNADSSETIVSYSFSGGGC